MCGHWNMPLWDHTHLIHYRCPLLGQIFDHCICGSTESYFVIIVLDVLMAFSFS